MVTAHLFGSTRNRNPARPETKTTPAPTNPVPVKTDVLKVPEKPSPPQTPTISEPTPTVKIQAPKVSVYLLPLVGNGMLMRSQTKAPLKPPTPAALATIGTPKIVKNASPWNDIPSDVLLEIVSYLRDNRYAVLSLILVCTYWRQVLVECPLNWTQISSLYPPRVFKSWIQRSKNVPIDADICSLPPGLYG